MPRNKEPPRKCDKCHKEFNKLSHLKQHQNRKKSCLLEHNAQRLNSQDNAGSASQSDAKHSDDTGRDTAPPVFKSIVIRRLGNENSNAISMELDEWIQQTCHDDDTMKMLVRTVLLRYQAEFPENHNILNEHLHGNYVTAVLDDNGVFVRYSKSTLFCKWAGQEMYGRMYEFLNCITYHATYLRNSPIDRLKETLQDHIRCYTSHALKAAADITLRQTLVPKSDPYVTCTLCDLSLKQSSLKDHHLNNCPKLECFVCNKQFRRDSLYFHLTLQKDSLHTGVPACKYRWLDAYECLVKKFPELVSHDQQQPEMFSMCLVYQMLRKQYKPNEQMDELLERLCRENVSH